MNLKIRIEGPYDNQMQWVHRYSTLTQIFFVYLNTRLVFLLEINYKPLEHVSLASRIVSDVAIIGSYGVTCSKQKRISQRKCCFSCYHLLRLIDVDDTNLDEP